MNLVKISLRVLFLTLFVFAIIGLSQISLFETEQAAAQAGGDHLTGWAWSSNIGWVSFQGTGYGVAVNSGELEGYAWSSNIGWIRFGGLVGCPGGGNCDARFSGNRIVGWARACAGAATPARRSWGSDVVGWVSFARAKHEGGATFSITANNVVINPGVTQSIPVAVVWTNAAGARRVDLAVTTNPLPAGVTLSFTGNRDRCSSYSGTTCSTEASLVVAGNASSGTYSITIKGDTSSPPALTASKSFNLTINDLPASVRLQVNGSDGPVRVIRGQKVKLTWTTMNVDACAGTNFSTGGVPNNPTIGVMSAPVLSATTYTLTCTRAGAAISDNRDTVTVSLKTPGGG